MLRKVMLFVSLSFLVVFLSGCFAIPIAFTSSSKQPSPPVTIITNVNCDGQQQVDNDKKVDVPSEKK